ncbi:MAG: helix-turn-helix transcriptional regulator [Lachnospiraceae bacterium]|nr:helix-turn-helix transcriptional regulator [Lachnospiraceae bacterium]
METNFISERITKLRLKKGVSEHRMSLDLGHARSYIHGISSGRTLPSMTEFLAICDYFEITPESFFSEESEEAILLTKLYNLARLLSEKDLTMIVDLAERLSQP